MICVFTTVFKNFKTRTKKKTHILYKDKELLLVCIYTAHSQKSLKNVLLSIRNLHDYPGLYNSQLLLNSNPMLSYNSSKCTLSYMWVKTYTHSYKYKYSMYIRRKSNSVLLSILILPWTCEFQINSFLNKRYFQNAFDIQ